MEKKQFSYKEKDYLDILEGKSTLSESKKTQILKAHTETVVKPLNAEMHKHPKKLARMKQASLAFLNS